MKTLTLNIIKKNRVYFKCETENGYEVKLKIDEKSKNLELGKQELVLNDISVRTKYGTDVIYELYHEVKKDEGICTFVHKYNYDLVNVLKNYGGRWDEQTKSWSFSKIVENEIEELNYLYNEDLVNIEIKSLRDLSECRGSVYFLGYPIARATGRDSGAFICDHVVKITGNICSGGSKQYWDTIIKEGCIFRLQVSKNLLKNVDAAEWEIKIL